MQSPKRALSRSVARNFLGFQFGSVRSRSWMDKRIHELRTEQKGCDSQTRRAAIESIIHAVVDVQPFVRRESHPIFVGKTRRYL